MTPHAAAKLITELVYSGLNLVYNTVNSVNCADCAAIVTTFANILGCRLASLPLGHGGATNAFRVNKVVPWLSSSFSAFGRWPIAVDAFPVERFRHFGE